MLEVGKSDNRNEFFVVFVDRKSEDGPANLHVPLPRQRGGSQSAGTDKKKDAPKMIYLLHYQEIEQAPRFTAMAPMNLFLSVASFCSFPSVVRLDGLDCVSCGLSIEWLWSSVSGGANQLAITKHCDRSCPKITRI